MYKTDGCICSQSDVPWNLVSMANKKMKLKPGNCGKRGYAKKKGSAVVKIHGGANINVIKYEKSPCSPEGFTNYQPRYNDLLNYPNNPQDSFRYDNYYDF